jgi:hypothetical protein
MASLLRTAASRQSRRMARLGSLGGKATLRRHGHSHFSRIGRLGFAALVSRRFGGDKSRAVAWLHDRAWHAVLSSLAAAMTPGQLVESVNRIDAVCDEYVRRYRAALAVA